MDIKKIKKAESSLLGMIVSLLLVVGIFTGLFIWINLHADYQNVTVDSRYNTTYQAYQNATNSISDNVDEISDKTKKITEASNVIQVAWNGLLGLGAVLKLPIKFVDSGQTILDSSLTQVTGIVPSWLIVLSRIILIAFIVLLVVYLLMGGGKPI